MIEQSVMLAGTTEAGDPDVLDPKVAHVAECHCPVCR
jgi:hypothetical protein